MTIFVRRVLLAKNILDDLSLPSKRSSERSKNFSVLPGIEPVIFSNIAVSCAAATLRSHLYILYILHIKIDYYNSFLLVIFVSSWDYRLLVINTLYVDRHAHKDIYLFKAQVMPIDLRKT